MRRPPLVLVLTALAALGCTSAPPDGLACSPDGDCPADQACYDGICLSEPPDGPPRIDNGEPPSVVSITPEDGASELPAGTPVVVTFSEPMDPESTLAALSIEPATEILSYQWNDDFSTLTINYALEIAEADYPDVPGTKLYSVDLASTAEDSTGNTLELASATSFLTKRLQVHTFDLVGGLGGHTTNPYTTGYTFVGGGDYGGNRWHGYMTFDIAEFPSELSGAVDSALVDTRIRQITNDPFGNFGKMNLLHSTFGARDEADDAPARSDLGTLIPAEPTPQQGDRFAIDVSTAFLDDIENRVERLDRSQYLLKYQDLPANVVAGTHRMWLYNSEASAEADGVDNTQLIVRTRVD